MFRYDNHPSGRHFLHIPGPSPVPDRVLRAMSHPTIDHRGPEFAVLGKQVLAGMQRMFQTTQPVVIYPASGTGAWEAALVNVCSPGDTVLMYETGHFAALWQKLAQRLGLVTQIVRHGTGESWRHGVDAAQIEAALRADTAHKIKCVCVVHNETSTGVTSNIAAVRAVMDAVKHPALLLVDTISGLGSADYKHDAWGVDVSISGSQKGLMLPPGISFNAISARAMAAAKTATLPKAYWAWDEIVEVNKTGYWPTTPNTNLLYALAHAIAMIEGEGLANVFARHHGLARACRAAVGAWGLETQCAEAAVHSPVLTGVMMPEDIDADAVRSIATQHFNLSLGTGLGKIKGRMFRIGHLGDCNALSLLAALSGCEMSLQMAGVKLKGSGVVAAMDVLRGETSA